MSVLILLSSGALTASFFGAGFFLGDPLDDLVFFIIF